MTTLILCLVFWCGFYFGKLDSKYGREYGYKFGTWMRVNLLRLPPIAPDEVRP